VPAGMLVFVVGKGGRQRAMARLGRRWSKCRCSTSPPKCTSAVLGCACGSWRRRPFQQRHWSARLSGAATAAPASTSSAQGILRGGDGGERLGFDSEKNLSAFGGTELGGSGDGGGWGRSSAVAAGRNLVVAAGADWRWCRDRDWGWRRQESLVLEASEIGDGGNGGLAAALGLVLGGGRRGGAWWS